MLLPIVYVASALKICHFGWTGSSTCPFLTTHFNIVHVASSLLLTAILCWWLLHLDPAVPAGLNQVVVPTAHCSIVHVPSTLPLTVILCR